jgi:hypothetical protein
MSTESLTQDLPDDLREAIEQCKEHQRQRPNAPADPPVIVVEAHGETCVCMPPSLESQDRLQKLLFTAMDDKKQFPRYFETFVAETVFWVRGQAGRGAAAAMTYLKAQRKSDFGKANLFGTLVGELQEQFESLVGSAPTSKKY